MKFPTTCLQVCCLCGEAFRRFVLLAVLGALTAVWAKAQAPAPAPAGLAIIITIEGRVEVLRGGAGAWVAAERNQRLGIGDKLRTGENSRATIQLANASVERLRSLTVITIEAPRKAEGGISLLLERGALFFKSWAKPETQEFRTPTVAGAIRGTEFYLTVADDGSTVVSLIDGEVNLTSPDGALPLKSGEQATIERGRAPAKTAVLETTRIVQWYLYYPGVLDFGELGFAEAQQRDLFGSWSAYAAGDLPNALRLYPAGRLPGNPSEAVYRAGLLLSVGEVAQAEAQLATVEATAAAAHSRPARLAAALREVIAAVQFRSVSTNTQPELASEWVARSYLLQSRFDLAGALHAAQQAVRISPNFGFAHARVAELEFSHGRTRETAAALAKALELSPRNAQALALAGFVRAAQNRHREAQESFEKAIEADGALGNGWLGRGLNKIRRGQTQPGLADLQIAAALEPNRALLRSYLGKAFGVTGDAKHADRELALARLLDGADPTPWLYSALLNEERGRVNAAVRDLEKSKALNSNRGLYRSRLSLDQDQAVRSANLAAIYRDAGFTDLSVREASRAVALDFGNYSAHLFLANSYDQLRDPNRINLRYETPALNEYLLANLLAPVGAGPLSQTISQQEYGRFFEQDGMRVTSSVEYLSRGAWTERGSQYGVFGGTSYSFEGNYRSDPGQRQNNDFEERELSLTLKQQLTPNDTLLLQVSQYESAGGDRFQYADPALASLGIRASEKQEPLLFLGYQHEWQPGVRTLALAGRIHDDFQFFDPRQGTLLVDRGSGNLDGILPLPITLKYRDRVQIYTGELEQLFQGPQHSLLLGGRYQKGTFQAQNLQTDPDFPVGFFDEPAADQTQKLNFERSSLYAYYRWKPFDPLLLTAGLAWDRITYPENFLSPPFVQRRETVERFSPKVGLVWDPSVNTTVRAAYARTMGGAILERSYTLEPSEVAGFNQAFRSAIPESVAGGNAGARFELCGVAIEQRLPSRTYLSARAEVLNSQVRRSVGIFEFDPVGFAFPSTTREQLDYSERSLNLSADQLLGDWWSAGVSYKLARASLRDFFPEVTGATTLYGGFQGQQDLTAISHQVNLHLGFNHRFGFFGRAATRWFGQSSSGYVQGIPSESVWQTDVWAGWRSVGRKVVVRLGLLNLLDTGYHINPLTLYNETPQHRTAAMQVRFSF